MMKTTKVVIKMRQHLLPDNLFRSMLDKALGKEKDSSQDIQYIVINLLFDYELWILTGFDLHGCVSVGR